MQELQQDVRLASKAVAFQLRRPHLRLADVKMFSSHRSRHPAGLGAIPGKLSALRGDEGQGPDAAPAGGDGAGNFMTSDFETQLAKQPAAAAPQDTSALPDPAAEAADSAASAAAGRRTPTPPGEGLPAAAEDDTAPDVTAGLEKQSASGAAAAEAPAPLEQVRFRV